MTREPIYSAIFAFFEALTIDGAAPLFNTATRKLKTWEDVPAEDQPALLMLARLETANRRKGLPAIWTLNIDLFLYVHTGAQTDPTVDGAAMLNQLLDAIEASLAIDDPSNNACTLGGLVSHCAINGPIQIYPGSLGDEAVAIVPIEVLVSP